MFFHESIPFPIGLEEDFANRYVELYGDDEYLVDGHHPRSSYFPNRSERAKMHAEYTSSNRPRDRTRKAYNDDLDLAIAEYQELNDGQAEYYHGTSGGMLPRHHAALLPLAREREEPSFSVSLYVSLIIGIVLMWSSNAISWQRLLEGRHNLGGQQTHWWSTDRAYTEHKASSR